MSSLYLDRPSPIHRLNPITKLVGVVAIILLVFALPYWWAPLAILVLIVTPAALLAKVGGRLLIVGGAILVPLLIVVAIGQGFFNALSGLSAAQDMLQAVPDLHVIVGSDQAITGALTAAAGAGVAETLKTVGYGGARVAIQRVADGGQRGRPPIAHLAEDRRPDVQTDRDPQGLA